MTVEHLQILAFFRAKTGSGDALQEVLLALVEPTRTETGCLRYELHRDREDPDRFTFVEEWTDEQALEAHFATEHIQQAGMAFPDLLEGSLEIRRGTRIG
jgi:quinol monooxygenase YgiN